MVEHAMISLTTARTVFKLKSLQKTGTFDRHLEVAQQRDALAITCYVVGSNQHEAVRQGAPRLRRDGAP